MRDHFIHGENAVDRQIFVHRQDRGAHNVGKLRRIGLGANHDREETVGGLILRTINRGHRTPVGQPLVNDRPDDSNDRQPLRRVARFAQRAELAANWILIRKPGTGAIIIDQCDPGRIFAVSRREVPAPQQGNSRCLKISRSDGQRAHLAGVLKLFRFRLAFKHEGLGADVSRSRQGRRGTGRFHAREIGQLRNELLEKARGGLFVRELRFGQADPEGQRARRIHANVRLLKIHEAPHHEAGANQQNQSEGDLRDDQRVAHPLTFRTA